MSISQLGLKWERIPSSSSPYPEVLAGFQRNYTAECASEIKFPANLSMGFGSGSSQAWKNRTTIKAVKSLTSL